MEHIFKSFSGIKALQDVQIDLRKGEIHALMGENGAGKSTLMKILTGVYTKDSGSIQILNEQTGKMEEVNVRTPLQGSQLGLSMGIRI